MVLINRSTRAADDRVRETPTDAGESSRRRSGRRALRRALLLGAATAVGVAVIRRRRRRPKREFTEIELDADPAEQ